MGTLRRSRSVVSTALAVALLSTYATPQETVRVSVDSTGAEGNDFSELGAISANGRSVAFVSAASNLVPGDTNGAWDVFVHDLATGVTERVSVDSTGAEGDDNSGGISISADGLIVAFGSNATNLVSGDTNLYSDIFVHDRTTGVTERVSVDSLATEANYVSFDSVISANGRFVAFTSLATNLVAGDTNNSLDVFVHDRATGVTERVSVDSAGNQGTLQSGLDGGPSISADGLIVAFDSSAWNLVPGDLNGLADIFVHDRSTGITERVSVSSSGAEADVRSSNARISADGRIVAFDSYADNLVAGDTNFRTDVFVHDRSSGTTERVSVDSSGSEGNDFSALPSISADGRFVAFWSNASNLVANDTNDTTDIFTHDRTTGLTERVSVASSGAESDSPSHDGSISGNGNVVAFSSFATNLVAGDTNDTDDVFVQGCLVDATWSNFGAGFPGTSGVPGFTAQQNPVMGTTVTLDLANSYGLPTAGLLFVGFQRTDIPSSFGGHLLVVPAVTLPITFSYGFDSFSGDIPDDRTLCGVAIDLQAFEADPGAAKGVSSTQGLELVLGN